MSFENRSILVTGANGFLGTRVVEILAVAYRARVRALVRDVVRSVRVCRLPVEIVLGDVRDEPAVGRAMDGCSVVIHCASGIDARSPRASSTFIGTETVARLAQRQKVRRFVHVSSAAVYGSAGEVEVNERQPLRPRWKNDTYGAAKIAGEQVVFSRLFRDLPATIVQPTIIYGPYSSEWSVHPLKVLSASNYALPKGGLVNPVYVDDVVQAIILAATKTEAVGQRYIVSGPETIDWSGFYQAYTRMGATGEVLEITDSEYRDLARRSRKRPGLLEVARVIARQPEVRNVLKQYPFVNWSYDLAKWVLPQAQFLKVKAGYWDEAGTRREPRALKVVEPFLPGPGLWRIYKSKSRYSIKKAQQELGYRPRVNLEQGMALTAEWARWARLI